MVAFREAANVSNNCTAEAGADLCVRPGRVHNGIKIGIHREGAHAGAPLQGLNRIRP